MPYKFLLFHNSKLVVRLTTGDFWSIGLEADDTVLYVNFCGEDFLSDTLSRQGNTPY